MVDKVPTAGNPEQVELDKVEAAVLNRMILQHQRGVFARNLYLELRDLLKKLGSGGMTLEEFERILLKYPSNLVEIKEGMYCPKLSEPIVPGNEPEGVTVLPLAE